MGKSEGIQRVYIVGCGKGVDEVMVMITCGMTVLSLKDCPAHVHHHHVTKQENFTTTTASSTTPL